MNARVSKLIDERPWYAILAILLAAAVLRLWNLDGPSLWIDEICSVVFAQTPFGLLWSDWMVYETNPPLYYQLLSAWMAMFGESEFAVRALSVVFGLAAIVAMFAFGRALHSAQAGVLAALFCAFSAEQLGYSQEARGYILGFLAATLSALALLRIADLWREGAKPLRLMWPHYALYAGATAVAVYTHTTFFILPLLANVFIAWLWVFRTPRRMSDAIGWAGANLVLAVLWAWWILMTIRQIQSGAETVSWIPTPTVRDTVAIVSHVVATRSFEIVNVLLAGVFGAVMLWGWWKLPVERRALALIFGVGVPFVLLSISLVRPIFLERTLFWVQFVYLACLAVGVATLPWARWRFAVAALVALVLMADALNWSRTAYREQWRELATVLRDNAEPGDAVVLYSASGVATFSYYCRRVGCDDTPVLAQATTRGKRGLGQFYEGPELTVDNAAAAVAGYRRLWVVARTEDDATPIVETVATLDGAERLNDETGRMRLTLWRVDAAEAE
jgi:4-amino-4-deoxy-L-arabinose transferase-like glycosyltransferase